MKRPGAFTHLCELKSGDIDDSICFSFPESSNNIKIDLQAIVLRMYFLLVDPLDIPLIVPQSLKITPQVTLSSCVLPLKMSRQKPLVHWKK